MRGSFWGGLRNGGEKVNAKSRTKESELHIPPSAGTERMWQVTGEGRTVAPKSQLAGSSPEAAREAGVAKATGMTRNGLLLP